MQIGELINQVKPYLPRLNEKRLRKAYDFAREAHRGQKRMDGSPYITHPLAATFILARFRVDENTLIACLLHDVSEDTKYTEQDIEKKFGKTVAFLVSGVTKLSKVKYRHDMAERQIESLKKFFLYSARDLRVILIKLADRLHNMQTLEYVRKEKQLRIAKETMEIYVPIANLLGIWELKSGLENICFKYIYPKEYEELKSLTDKETAHHKKRLKDTSDKVRRELKKHQVDAEIQSRPKSLYSTFRKMVNHGDRLQDLNDLLALRIIVKDRDACYRVLGIIHTLFRPKSGRIKDYISIPKPNGYQGLHTTVFGIDGTPTEFQIRTYSMHFEAEYGIAAHYFYKENSERNAAKLQGNLQKRSEWMQRVLELQKDFKSNNDFLENLKIDVFQDRIFVFTPRGDVVDLPRGANGIDFAYHIHTGIGDHAVRILRNGQESSLSTVLETGDTIEVLTSEEQKLPKREWLGKAKTNLARAKIKTTLKTLSRTESYQEGLQFLKKELHHYGCDEVGDLTKAQKARLLKTFHSKTWHEFVEMVGKGTVPEDKVMETLYTKKEILGSPYRSGSNYITPLTKISYKTTPGRLIAPTNNESVPYYRIRIALKCKDRVGLLRDIGIQLANLGINIYQIGVTPRKAPDQMNVELVIEVIDLNQVRSAFESLESLDAICDFHRARETGSKESAKSLS